ncbi:MAG TPA: SGNH/GDSL hydrolase family protein [Planctomycetota bacterium]|nr:SGNH/GDSL hydrolase family protein [Planctomycetota bacterium]
MSATLLLAGAVQKAKEKDAFDYAEPMRKAAAKFTGKEGVVVHLGDSITYANGYSGWARGGKGKTPQDQAVCKWMHTGEDNDLDGFFLCRVDRPGNRSDTACSGIRSDEYLAGGKSGMPSLAEILKKYNPQIAVVMLGTNDVTAGKPVAEYKANMGKIADALLANGTVPILSTIPPYPGKEEAAKVFNAGLAEVVKEKRLPSIDFWGEIMKRRPNDWNGTLLGKNDVHPTSEQGGANPASEPTEENLKNSGLLLRGWLSVRKIAEVKEQVVDKVRRK